MRSEIYSGRIKNRFLDILLYSSASLSVSFTYQFFSARYIHFYTDELKVAPYLVSIILVIYGVWNAINDPLFGWISDKTNTRWGKRFPYILFGFIPFSLAFVAVWLPDARWIGKTTLLFIYMILTFFLFDGLFTLVVMNWTALFPEKYKTTKERNYVSALRQIFSILGLIIAFIIPPIIIKTYGNFRGYKTVAFLLGGISFLNLGISLFACKDPERTDTQKEEDYFSFKQSLTVLKNKNFIAFMIGNMCINLAFITMMGILPFYNKYILEQDIGNETFLNGAAIGGALLFVFFWAYLSIKKGAKIVYILSSIVFSIGLLPLFFISTNIIVIVIIALVGAGLGGLLVIPDVLIADVIDEDAAKVKRRREGLFFGMNGFAIRIAIVIQAGVFGLITSLTNFDSEQTVQPDSAILGIKILMVIIPIISLLAGIVTMLFIYDLVPSKVKRIRQILKNDLEKE